VYGAVPPDTPRVVAPSSTTVISPLFELEQAAVVKIEATVIVGGVML
jgi:hypothetical protein